MGEDSVLSNGLTRRDLIKGAAVAGGLAWAAPVLQTSDAWATTDACNTCNGVTLYSKFAPGGSHTTGNQCLAPCPPVTVIAFDLLVCNGLASVTKNASAGTASISFPNQVRLLRTAIKSQSDCFMATSCVPGDNVVPNPAPFDFTYINATSTNPQCVNGTSQDISSGTSDGHDGIFDWQNPDLSGGSTMVYNVNPQGQTANYIEILLCLQSTTKAPTDCPPVS